MPNDISKNWFLDVIKYYLVFCSRQFSELTDDVSIQ